MRCVLTTALSLLAFLVVLSCDSKRETSSAGSPEKALTDNLSDEMNSDAPLSQEEFTDFIRETKAELEALDKDELITILDGAMQETQAALPVETIEGMMISDMKRTDSAVVYYVICDESVYNMDDFENATENERSMMTEDVLEIDPENPQNAIFTTLCKVAGLDIVFLFIGSDTEKSFEVKIGNELMLQNI